MARFVEDTCVEDAVCVECALEGPELGIDALVSIRHADPDELKIITKLNIRYMKCKNRSV